VTASVPNTLAMARSKPPPKSPSSTGSSSPSSPSSSLPSAPDIQLIGDHATIYPAGYTETADGSPSSSTTTTLDELGSGGVIDPDAAHTERELIEQMSRFRANPLEFLREVSLYVSGREWRSYDDIVGQPVFYAGFSERMKRSISMSPMLRRKVEELASKRVEVELAEGLLVARDGEDGGKKAAMQRREREIRKSLDEVVEKMMDDMICKMESKRFIRGAYYLATQLLTRAYHQGMYHRFSVSLSLFKNRE
jgi:hypothetical protein